MTLESSFALALAILVLGLTPGPGVFAIVARALAHGFRPTVPFMVGIVMGDLVYLVLAAMGLSVIATQYAPVFSLLKIAGGLYLVYLGVQTWRAAKETDTLLTPAAPRHTGRSLVSGLSLTLGNPKVVVFYVAFLPAFMDLGGLSVGDLAMASVIVSVTLFAVLAGYAFMAARARRLFTSRRAVGNLHRGAGVLMVGAGGVVATN